MTLGLPGVTHAENLQTRITTDCLTVSLPCVSLPLTVSLPCVTRASFVSKRKTKEKKTNGTKKMEID